MKILICATEYYPHGSGIANVAYNVVEQLKKTGVDCVVCSPTGPDIKLGTQRPFGILGLLFYWYKVATHFKKSNTQEFDAVWLHNPLFLKESPFNNCLVTMNATAYGQANNRIYPLWLHIYKIISAKIEKFSLSKIKDSSLFTGVGTNICEELEEIGIKSQNIKYIPNGVNIDQFKPSKQKQYLRNKFGIPDKDLVFLNIGRLTPQKNPLKTIEVFEKISTQVNNLTLVFSGKGELKSDMDEDVKSKNLDNVLLIGYVDEENKPDLYACADYFIISSLYEGGEPPLTLSEAMACGLPCIASNIPNFKIVEISNSGIVVDFSDTNKSAEEILNFIQKDNSECSINARKYAVQNLDWGIISDNYLNEFSKIVK
ncbi:glycosyltransferase family 4 protein [Methanosarcina sp. Z-7115]|uniref:Glycosyltransferase family 4 protein n=1 Tax=Methanosarcina baikalica TaxID=3073890 RepID=A0ABU2CZG1_9EURY|nr:glycosyltransferase family 4 protein [Methanosarcina sp. Z-7115]MDR7665093.1 glycosyltransferase family 4 protein [Methanosarcina sp. Z-7115]